MDQIHYSGYPQIDSYWDVISSYSTNIDYGSNTNSDAEEIPNAPKKRWEKFDYDGLHICVSE